MLAKPLRQSALHDTLVNLLAAEPAMSALDPVTPSQSEPDSEPEPPVSALPGEELPKVVDTGFYWYDAANMADANIAAVLYD